MSLLVKVFVCHLVYLQIVSISCQQPLQQNGRIQTFFNDLKKLLHIPVSNRANPELKQNQYAQTQPPKALSEPDSPKEQNNRIPLNNNNIKNNDDKKLNPDCSDQIELTCEEQRTLLDNIFKNNKPRSKTINVSNRYGIDPNNEEPETHKADDIETTTDYGLNDRIAAEIVASFLG